MLQKQHTATNFIKKGHLMELLFIRKHFLRNNNSRKTRPLRTHLEMECTIIDKMPGLMNNTTTVTPKHSKKRPSLHLDINSVNTKTNPNQYHLCLRLTVTNLLSFPKVQVAKKYTFHTRSQCQ